MPPSPKTARCKRRKINHGGGMEAGGLEVWFIAAGFDAALCDGMVTKEGGG